MRIVGGNLKGRALSTPRGRDTRPTSDRAREAIFNVLQHVQWAPPLTDARILDIFAGSGALGFEALSRGAAFCLFVDTSSAARGAIRANIDAFQLFGATRIHRRSGLDLGRKPPGLGPPFNLVFLDPPYGENLAPPALGALLSGDWVSPNAIAIVETGKNEPLDAPGWIRLDERAYGAADIRFLRPDLTSASG